MNPDIASGASAVPAGPLPTGRLAKVLRVPRHLLWLALAFGFAKTCFDAVSMATLYPDYPFWRPAATAFVWNVALVVPLLFGIAAAERSASTRSTSWYPYAAAAAGAAVIGSVLGAALEQGLGLDCCYSGDVPPFHAVFASGFFINLLICGLVAIAFVYRRNALRRIQALHGAQLELALLAKQTHEASLQAIQARVEPQFLFSTLTQVEQLYEHDPQRAGRMLDELIVYLRAALPHLRDTSSTVEKEIALTQAYVNIARIRLGDALACEIAVTPEARDARFPPMVLLPVIDHVLGSGRLDIDVTVVASRVQVLIRGERGPDGLDVVIETLRDRLRALYGEDARIELTQANAGGVEIAIEIPYERA